MKIKLKKGLIVPRGANHHNLDMEDFNDLVAGKAIIVKKIPESLKGFVEREKKDGN